MQKLVLKYNALISDDHFPKIEGLVQDFGLKIENVEDIKNNTYSHIKLIHVVGHDEGLNRLNKALERNAAITRKMI